jgi:glycosyltransferase involved in cell wall biosynthesis
MRVAHLDTGRTWRGGQAQVRFLLRGLRDRGHDVLLLAPRGPLLDRVAAEGIDARAWRPWFELDPLAIAAAARAFRAFRPDVVHAHSAHAHPLAVLAAGLAGDAPVVVSRRVDFAVARGPWSALKYRMPVARYLCISRGVMDVMRAGGVADAKLAWVPSGVEFPDPPGPGAADLRALLGAPADAPVIGTVAALAPHKNHADLLRAAARVVRERPGVHFAWVGEGECRAALERERARLGLESRVHLLGFRHDAHALLAQFTVFCLSSWLEGLCTSLLDAQSLGVPIVATRVGGVPDVVEDDVTGRLVPSRDPAALAEALLDALAHPAEARGRAERARQTVRAFSIENTIARTLGVYAEVAGGRGRA